METTKSKEKETRYVLRGWQRILLFIIPSLIVIGIFQAIGAVISGVNLSNLDELQMTSFQRMIASFSGMIGLFLILWVFMKFIDKEKFIKLGFQIKNRRTDILTGIGVGFLVMAVGYLLLVSTGNIIFDSIQLNITQILISILLFIVVAVFEETLFRGYILKNLMLSYNKYVALIISSILFALGHSLNPNMNLFSYIDLFLAGMALGISYIYTKNLWFPIALHFSWNLFQTFFGFKVSGQESYSIIKLEIPHNNLWNGGEFGFEGSVLSIVAEILIVVGVVMYYDVQKQKSCQVSVN